MQNSLGGLNKCELFGGKESFSLKSGQCSPNYCCYERYSLEGKIISYQSSYHINSFHISITTYSIILLLSTSVHGPRPDYLTDSVHPYSYNDPARYRLRSATGTNYSVPRTRTKFCDRAFSVAGPVVWNSLPAAVHHSDSLHSFKRRLKSHFFSLCFND